MPKPKPTLPSRPEDTWTGGFVFDQPQPVRDLSGAGGLVFAGGEALLMLRPGAQRWQMRPPPEDLGAVFAVAAEQGPPWRYAVASEGGITLFGLPKDQVLTLRSSTEAPVTHMAWGALGKERVLYLRWNDGDVGRVRLDLGTVEDLVVLPMDALASDANGVVAMVSVSAGAADAHALTTRDGTRFEERPAIPVPGSGSPEARVHLAVAGAAVAYAVAGIDGGGAWLSRSDDDDFAPCEGLPGGGPLAFHGSSHDSALFGASWERAMAAIHRIDGKGGVQRIAEIGSEGAEAPRLSALLWDESRRVLWAASPALGLMRQEEPKGKGGKKRSLN
jgi:hypothetical protein